MQPAKGLCDFGLVNMNYGTLRFCLTFKQLGFIKGLFISIQFCCILLQFVDAIINIDLLAKNKQIMTVTNLNSQKFMKQQVNN